MLKNSDPRTEINYRSELPAGKKKSLAPIFWNSKKREGKFLCYHIIPSLRCVTNKISLNEKLNPSPGKYKQSH